MRTIQRSEARQPVHDHVVELVARQWANTLRFNIATNQGSEKNRWAGSHQNYPDLVGWVRDGAQDRLVWVAEVETEDTVSEAEARGQWREYAALPVPFYLIVPKGYAATARQLVAKVGITLDAVYEYSFVNGAFQLTN